MHEFGAKERGGLDRGLINKKLVFWILETEINRISTIDMCDIFQNWRIIEAWNTMLQDGSSYV